MGAFPAEPTIMVVFDYAGLTHLERWLYRRYAPDHGRRVSVGRLYDQYLNVMINKFDYRAYCSYSQMQDRGKNELYRDRDVEGANTAVQQAGQVSEGNGYGVMERDEEAAGEWLQSLSWPGACRV